MAGGAIGDGYYPKVTEATAQAWFDKLIEPICIAFLYEYLSYDDDEDCRNRINDLIRDQITVGNKDFAGFARENDKQGNTVMIAVKDKTKMAEIRDALAKVNLPPIYDDEGKQLTTGDERTAYTKIVTAFSQLEADIASARTKSSVGRPDKSRTAQDTLLQLMDKVGDIVKENPDGEPTCTSAAADNVDLIWACPGIERHYVDGSPGPGSGSRYVSGVDFLLLMNIIANTSIVSKGALVGPIAFDSTSKQAVQHDSAFFSWDNFYGNLELQRGSNRVIQIKEERIGKDDEPNPDHEIKRANFFPLTTIRNSSQGDAFGHEGLNVITPTWFRVPSAWAPDAPSPPFSTTQQRTTYKTVHCNRQASHTPNYVKPSVVLKAEYIRYESSPSAWKTDWLKKGATITPGPEVKLNQIPVSDGTALKPGDTDDFFVYFLDRMNAEKVEGKWWAQRTGNYSPMDKLTMHIQEVITGDWRKTPEGQLFTGEYDVSWDIHEHTTAELKENQCPVPSPQEAGADLLNTGTNEHCLAARKTELAKAKKKITNFKFYTSAFTPMRFGKPGVRILSEDAKGTVVGRIYNIMDPFPGRFQLLDGQDYYRGSGPGYSKKYPKGTLRKNSANRIYSNGTKIERWIDTVGDGVAFKTLVEGDWGGTGGFGYDLKAKKKSSKNKYGGDTVWVGWDPSRLQGPNSVLSMAAYTSRIIARIARNYPKKLAELLLEVLKDLYTQVESAEADSEDKSFAEVTSDETAEIEGLLPYDLQCFLLENIRQIAGLQDKLLNDRAVVWNRGYHNVGVIADILGTEPQLYDIMANHRQKMSVQPGNLISYINHGGPEKTLQAEALLNLCPDAYALLTPYMKIYRVDYREDDTLVPYRETEIPFPTFIDSKDITQITQGISGRYGGAGIKSFSWNLDGVNSAEVENNISANLTLRFQTLEDIFSLSSHPQAGLGGEGEVAQPSYLDLIIGSGTSFRTKPVEEVKAHPRAGGADCLAATVQTYDGARFRVRIDAGWACPPGFANMEFRNFERQMGPPGSTETYGEFLERAINDSRVALYLDVTGHELNFNEDGSVDLEVRYQASLTGILKSPNADIFMGGTELDQAIKEYRESMLETEKAQDVKIEEQKSLGNDSGFIESIENKRIKAREKLDKITKRNKAQKYKRFLCNLYEKSKIYILRVDTDEFRRYKDMTPKERAELAKQRLDPSDTSIELIDPQLADTSDIDALILRAEKNIKEAQAGQDPRVGVRFSEKSVRTGIKKKHLRSKELDVPYIYLGDLLDGVLQYMTNIVDTGDDGLPGSFQMLLGSIEILDPLMAFQYKNAVIKCAGHQEQEVVRALADINPLRYKGAHKISFYTNIGSLPISLDYFQEWFINNIVRPQIENYSFLTFVKSLCSLLIGKAFNSKCFDEVLNYQLMFDTAIFGLGDSFTGRVVSPAQVAQSRTKALRKAKVPLDTEMDGSTPIIPTLVLYSRDSVPAVSTSERENLENGIYQHYLGASCGLTKKISFVKQDMPYNRASRLRREGSLSAYQLRELYNVNIDMIGNTLHKNGQYIKVDPTAVGVGASAGAGNLPNLASLLGIGGYYLVSSVSHTISSAGFDVKVTGFQEGLEIDAHELVALQPYLEEEKKSSPKKKKGK